MFYRTLTLSFGAHVIPRQLENKRESILILGIGTSSRYLHLLQPACRGQVPRPSFQFVIHVGVRVERLHSQSLQDPTPRQQSKRVDGGYVFVWCCVAFR